MSRLHVGLALLFVLAACLFAPPCSNAWQINIPRPDDNNFTINGNVYFADGNQPAAHVLVQLNGTEGSQRETEETSEAGWFEFRRISAGSYTLEVDVQGYERATTSVDISLMPARGIVIRLKSASGEKGGASSGTISAHELSIPQKARDLVSSGRKKMQVDKNPQAALQDFQAAIAAAPGYYEAYYHAGMAYLALGKRDDAESSFRKSIELSGNKYCEADVALGTMMLDRSDFAEGEKTVRQGLELNPQYWLGHYELGRALLSQNKISEALKAADQAKSLAPTAPVVYRLLSNIHLQQKDYPALLADIDAYIKLDPDSAAGIRAKQLREQVAQKVDAAGSTPASPKNP